MTPEDARNMMLHSYETSNYEKTSDYYIFIFNIGSSFLCSAMVGNRYDVSPKQGESL